MSFENSSNSNTLKRVRRNAVGTRDINNMRIEKVVGSGTFGVVYKATDKQTNETVALKKIKMERELQGFPVTAIREIKILSLMKNENVVLLREIVTYNENISGDNSDTTTDFEPSIANKGFNIGDVFMVFEFVDYDLSGLLKSSGFILSDLQVRSYLFQLLSGVKFLHEHNILHRDLKSANLLVTRNNILKIADWGLARTFKQYEEKFTNPVVTLWYRSPEVILGSRYYLTEVDMWSVGCIFAEMKTKIPMFRGENEAQQLDLIFQLLGSPTNELLETYKQLPDWEKINFTNVYDGNGKLRSKYPSFDNYSISLLEKMLELDPKERITASDALETYYFTGTDRKPPHYSDLPLINVEPVTEFLEQERLRVEHENRKLLNEERLRKEKEREEQLLKANQPASTYQVHQVQHTARGGRFNRGGGRGGADNNSKYKIIKPDRK